MMLLARSITQRYSTPTNNRLRSSSNIRNQIVVQADRVNIQSRNVGNDGKIARHSYNNFFDGNISFLDVKELSVNICMMARIQPANIESDEGLSYDSTFISEVQTPSTSYMNLLFLDSNHEQTYHEQPKIINVTIGDDQINSDIIFDDPNVEVNSGSVEHDKNAHDSHDNKLEQ
ncbi:hypothetical protein Tco_1151935 [Tanacetum coccineum]